MKLLRAIVFLIFLQIVLALHFGAVKAETTVQITNVTPVDLWGNTDYTLDRGLQTSLVIVLDSQSQGTSVVTASLSDTTHTPVGYTKENFVLNSGENTITLNLDVSGYAFVGLGNLHIVVSQLNQVPINSFDINIYIDVLGDFDGDNIINFQDVSIFAESYISYRQNYVVSSQYRPCDITGDGKIDFDDLSAFAIAYIAYQSYS